jgi:hypothetical protein
MRERAASFVIARAAAFADDYKIECFRPGSKLTRAARRPAPEDRKRRSAIGPGRRGHQPLTAERKASHVGNILLSGREQGSDVVGQRGKLFPCFQGERGYWVRVADCQGRDEGAAVGKRYRVRTSDKVKPASREALDAMNEGVAQLVAFTERLRQRPEAQPTAPAPTIEGDPALREELVAADEERTERMLRARNEAVASGLEPKAADEIMREFARCHPPDAN